MRYKKNDSSCQGPCRLFCRAVTFSQPTRQFDRQCDSWVRDIRKAACGDAKDNMTSTCAAWTSLECVIVVLCALGCRHTGCAGGVLGLQETRCFISFTVHQVMLQHRNSHTLPCAGTQSHRHRDQTLQLILQLKSSACSLTEQLSVQVA